MSSPRLKRAMGFSSAGTDAPERLAVDLHRLDMSYFQAFEVDTKRRGR